MKFNIIIFALSWRNIWRSKTRSLIIISAITLGIFSGVFSWAFYYGMMDQRVQTAIKTESSHIQIHDTTFLENPELKAYIKNVPDIITEIKKHPEVNAVSQRIIVHAMLSSAENAAGIKVMGIDPEKEKEVTNLFTKIVEGDYFDSSKKKTILIGEKLAKKLKVSLNSKLVLTFQDTKGDLSKELFKIRGIYKTSNSMYDEMTVFVRASEFASMLKMQEGSCHEIAILLNDNLKTEEITEDLKKQYPDFDIKSWATLMPEVSMVQKSIDVSMYVFMIIILVGLLFGIVNTMLMSVLERMRELGMLMAVGMSKLKVFVMIMLESVMLSLTGGATGIVTAYAVSLWFASKGIDISAFSEATESLGYDLIAYPQPKAYMGIAVALMVIATGILSAVFPAIKAIKLRPAEAVRNE